MDGLIDIMNGNHAKGCGPINHPDHLHLDELKQILKVFCEWKIEAGDKKENFILISTFEDII